MDTSHIISVYTCTATIGTNSAWNGRSWLNTKIEIWRSDSLPVSFPITIKKFNFFHYNYDRNGRDVHRELCGFMFLSDESMTIYEFRQFGQRLSALPLIPRAVYHHPVGRRNGEKYELHQIKKVKKDMGLMVILKPTVQGTTLFFDTSRLTSLPESLIQRPFLAVRITDVDETAKWNLM